MRPPTHLPIPLHRPPRLVPGRRAAAAIGAVGALLAAMVTSLAFTASSSATTVPGPPSGWTTTYSDSFAGSAGSRVDSGWTYDTGTQYNGTGCTANYGTGEVESNTSSTANVSEDGSGHLNITAVNSGGSWTSGRIETTSDSFEAPAGGEMEVSASIKQPDPASGVGYWPAFWMLGAGFRSSGAGTSGTMDCSNWPSAGEIDIMEDVNALSEHSGTFHCGVDPGGPCNETTGLGSGLQSCSGCQTGYNTYSAIVNRTNTSDESITFYLNGNAYYTVTESQVGTSTWQAAVDHGFFLILDLAIGGAYPNAICGCSSPTSATSSGGAMSVGYVAVYETSGSSASPTPTPTRRRRRRRPAPAAVVAAARPAPPPRSRTSPRTATRVRPGASRSPRPAGTPTRPGWMAIRPPSSPTATTWSIPGSISARAPASSTPGWPPARPAG